MSESNLQTVRDLKHRLGERFGAEPWFNGVGVVRQGDGFALRLNVSPESDVEPSNLPHEFEGVPVEIVRVAYHAR